jgi:hypothetical protein
VVVVGKHVAPAARDGSKLWPFIWWRSGCILDKVSCGPLFDASWRYDQGAYSTRQVVWWRSGYILDKVIFLYLMEIRVHTWNSCYLRRRSLYHASENRESQQLHPRGTGQFCYFPFGGELEESLSGGERWVVGGTSEWPGSNLASDSGSVSGLKGLQTWPRFKCICLL